MHFDLSSATYPNLRDLVLNQNWYCEEDSNFQTLVNVMYEMTINDVKHYVMVDPEPAEADLMEQN
jgi:hypothetical protein